MSESDDKRPEPDSLVDRHGFDNVMRGFLAVKPKDEDEKPKKRKPKGKKRSTEE